MHWETDTIRRSILTHSYLLNEIWEPREVLCTSNTVLASGCLSKNKQVSPNFAWFRQVRQRSIGHVKWCETSCVQSSALTWGDMSSDGPWNCNVTPMSLVLTPHCLCSSQVCHGLEIFDVNLAHSFAKTPRCDLNWPQLISFLSPWIIPLCVSCDAICYWLTPLSHCAFLPTVAQVAWGKIKIVCGGSNGSSDEWWHVHVLTMPSPCLPHIEHKFLGQLRETQER